MSLAGAGAAAAPFLLRDAPLFGAAPLSAQDVVERIKQHVGVAWKTDTVDGFKAGDPATAVTGIVTTAMATIAVLNDAVKRGANLVITAEPTFYGKADSPTPPAGRGRGGPGAAPAAPPPEPPADPVFAAKRDLIAAHKLVVWRFSDHWRLVTPDPLARGLIDAAGWPAPASGESPARVTIPPVTLDAFVTTLKKKLGSRGGIRVVGDPALRVQHVGLLPGSTPIQATLALLPTVDVVVAGEVREWESVEYARDLVYAHKPKALVAVGRVVSEDPGMRLCARWLGDVVPEVKTHWIGVGDPYWRPL